jgi:hypothetical protein
MPEIPVDPTSSSSNLTIAKGVVVRWVLGKHNNGHDLHLPRLLHLASTHWIAKQNLAPGPLLEAPLARPIYEAAAAASAVTVGRGGGVQPSSSSSSSSSTSWWFDDGDDDSGGSLVLVDDDSGVSLELLEPFVALEAQRMELAPPWPQV